MEEHRLHIRRNALPGAAAARQKTADETAALDILHVRGGEVLHALAEHAALRQHPEGDRARELHFPQRVQPGDVRRRVGLGIAERLRFPERVAVGKTAALHGVEHVVRCAVQNAGNGLNAVGLRREREIVEKRHAAAARRAEEKRRALFPRERRKLQTVRRDHRLVCGDEVLPGLKRAHTIGICRSSPPSVSTTASTVGSPKMSAASLTMKLSTAFPGRTSTGPASMPGASDSIK